MIKRLLLAILLSALAAFPVHADPTVKPGHVMGNGTSAERTPTDTPLSAIIGQPGSGLELRSIWQYAGSAAIDNGTIDAGPALQSAVNSCSTQYCVIALPPATTCYNIVTPVTWRAGVSLEGQDTADANVFYTAAGGSKLCLGESTAPMITLPGASNANIETNVSSAMRFSHVRFEGNNRPQPIISAPDTLGGRGSWAVTIDHSTFMDGRPAIYAANSWDWWIHDNGFIRSGNVATGTGNQVAALYIFNSNTAGGIDNSNYWRITDNFFDTTDGRAIQSDCTGVGTPSANWDMSIVGNHFGPPGGHESIYGCFNQSNISGNLLEGAASGLSTFNLSGNGAGRNVISNNIMYSPGIYHIIDGNTLDLISNNSFITQGSSGYYINLTSTAYLVTVSNNKTNDAVCCNGVPLVFDQGALDNIIDNDGLEGSPANGAWPVQLYGTVLQRPLMSTIPTIGDCLNWGANGIADAGSPCGLGGGAVSSVSNSDGTLTISPTTGAVVASLNFGHANTWLAPQTFAGASPQIVIGSPSDGNNAKVQLYGATSGSLTIEPQSVPGSPQWTAGTSSGTPAVTASAPLAISTATGNISITGAAGQVLAGATPAFTATPILGTSGVAAGSISLYGNTSTAPITINTAYVGSSAYNASIPALTGSDTFDMIGLAQTLSNKTLASPVLTGTVTGNGTIPIAVLSGLGANIGTALGIAANAASGFPLINSVLPTVGHCLQWGASGVTDAGGACTTGGGGGTVSSGNAYDLAYYAANGTTVSGLTPGTSGQFLVENGSVVPTWVTASGDCTLANTGALTCTKTSGTAFGALATVTPGTGVPTAVSVNIGTAGSFVVNGGALGTPSSGTATYLTGLPLAGLASQAANTVVGALTATTPSALAMPSCYGAGSALQWQIAAGFQCNTSISAASAPASGLTGTTLPSGVTLSSLTSVGTLTSLTTSGLIIVDLNSAAPAALTGSGLQIVAANSTAANVEIMTFGVDYPSFVARTANGTEASPSGVLSGAVLADFDTRPFDGTSWASVGTSGVHMVAQENFSATAHGSYLDFRCTAPTTTTQLSCGTVTSTGFQGAIGATTAATGKFTTLLATSLALNGATIGSNALAITGTAAISSTLTSAADTITSASANALAVGLNGATNPAFNVDASTASSATGINIKSAAAAGGLAISVISSGTNEALTINAKGSGTIGIGNVSTGAVTITPATTLSAALTYGGVTLSNAVTGTGNMVLSASPTFSGTVAGAGTHPLSVLATQAANTVVGNATASSASPTALAMTSCSTAASAVNWTTSTGFGCNTSVTAAAVPLSGITGLGLNVPTALAIAASTAGGPAIYGSVPTIANFGAPGTITAPATTYYMGYQTSTTENTSNWITPRAGTFRNLYASVNIAPGTGQTFTVTLRVNGASPASGPTCTISAAATTCNDLTHTATITAGQPYDLLFVTSTTAAATVPVGSAELDQ